MINDRETFFKGMEVGRAMRGWRTPDSPSYPSGTKYIYQNGEYDVAQFETASVNVNQTDAISAELVRELCTGAAYHSQCSRTMTNRYVCGLSLPR